MKNKTARKNINFRETSSERSATLSYRQFGKYLKQRFTKFIKPKYGTH
ncbi:hypothetical protein M1615_04555 [Patescibacteria group bacterium]|nr:hypothetical protein [Patescibacteria group bacterium]